MKSDAKARAMESQKATHRRTTQRSLLPPFLTSDQPHPRLTTTGRTTSIATRLELLLLLLLLIATATTMQRQPESQRLCRQQIIAEKMHSLSLNERGEVYEDIHGVKRNEESPEFIKTCLERLTREIRKLTKLNTIYSRALLLNRRYVKDKDFELMFLRADKYDITKAAKRLVFHFEKKLELFVYERLTRDIGYHDLDEDDIGALEDCVSCLVPTIQDTTGRAIHFVPFNSRLRNPSSQCHDRAGWYKYMTTLQRSEETQKRGYITVLFSHGTTLQQFFDRLAFQKQHTWVVLAVPVRLSAVHVCLHSDFLKPILSKAMGSDRPGINQRTKLHYGSIMETAYELSPFGISPKIVPLDADSNINLDLVRACLDEMKTSDEHKHNVTTAFDDIAITEVRENDVLLGKGPPYRHFPGNVTMFEIIREFKPTHDAAHRRDKQEVAGQVLQRIKDNGGRFLQREDDGASSWTEVADNLAHEKVAMGFRNMTKQAKSAEKKRSGDRNLRRAS